MIRSRTHGFIFASIAYAVICSVNGARDSQGYDDRVLIVARAWSGPRAAFDKSDTHISAARNVTEMQSGSSASLDVTLKVAETSASSNAWWEKAAAYVKAEQWATVSVSCVIVFFIGMLVAILCKLTPTLSGVSLSIILKACFSVAGKMLVMEVGNPLALAALQFSFSTVFACLFIVTRRVKTTCPSLADEIKSIKLKPCWTWFGLCLLAATSSLSVKVGAMKLPLTSLQMLRSLNLPCTQTLRCYLLGVPVTGLMLLYTGIVTCGCAIGNVPVIKSVRETHSYQWVLIMWLVFAGVLLGRSLSNVCQERVQKTHTLDPILVTALKNFGALLWLIPVQLVARQLGFEEGIVAGIVRIGHSSPHVLTLLAFYLSNKFIASVGDSFIIGVADSFTLAVSRRMGQMLITFPLELIAFYVFRDRRIGVPWEQPDSWYTVVGVALVCTGMLIKFKFEDRHNSETENAKREHDEDR